MPKVKVDGVEIEVPQGASVLRACELAGKEGPHFCYHERRIVEARGVTLASMQEAAE